MKLRQRRRDPDPLAQVRQVASELEELFGNVGDLVETVAADVCQFAAGVNDTAGQMRRMARTAERNTRESDEQRPA